MPRREFKNSVRAEIIKRAMDAKGVVRCEECRAAVKGRNFHIDHTIPDAIQVDKSKPLTAADGRLLCAGSRETCHGKKTAEIDQPAISKAKRVEVDHLRAKTSAPSRFRQVTRSELNDRKATRSRERSGDRLPQHAQQNARRLPRGFVSAGDPR